MSKTEKNLMDAFAGESQANRKYLAYAKVADQEGKAQIAKLFRAAAAAETIHAHAHLRNAGKIGDTAANLKDALEGETYELWQGTLISPTRWKKCMPSSTRRPSRTPTPSPVTTTSAPCAATPTKVPLTVPVPCAAQRALPSSRLTSLGIDSFSAARPLF